MEYKIQSRQDYSKQLLCSKTKIPIKYYTVRQTKAFYPNLNFIVAGEIGGKTGVQSGTAKSPDGQILPVYREKTHNILTETVAGYTAVDRHIYLAVVKNVLLKRIVVTIFILAAVCAAVVLEMHIL